jgi:hypothetical protein
LRGDCDTPASTHYRGERSGVVGCAWKEGDGRAVKQLSSFLMLRFVII